MFESLSELVAEYEDVLRRLSDPAIISDPRKLRDVSRRHHELEPVVDAYRAYRDTTTDLELAQEMLAGADGEDRELLAEEIEAAEGRLAGLEDELKVLLLPA